MFYFKFFPKLDLIHPGIPKYQYKITDSQKQKDKIIRDFILSCYTYEEQIHQFNSLNFLTLKIGKELSLDEVETLLSSFSLNYFEINITENELYAINYHYHLVHLAIEELLQSLFHFWK